MWKILGLLLFCSLLSPSVGKVPGIRSVFNNGELNGAFASALKQNNCLLNHLKRLSFADIKLDGLLGVIGNIVGLKVIDAQLTGSGVVFLQDKFEINLSVHLEITGDAILTTTSVVTIAADVDFKIIIGFANFLQGNFDFIFHQCGPSFGAIKITLLGGVLPPLSISTIERSIISDITLQACTILKVAFEELKVILVNTINVVLPLDLFGNVKCQLAALPAILDTHFGIDVFVDLVLAGTGAVVSIPETVVSINVPPLQNYRHCQGIHPALVNIALSVLGPKKPRELSCTPDAYSKADELRNAILALIPGGGSPSVTSGILYLKISPLVDPVIVFERTGGVVSVSVEIEVSIKNADGSVFSVLVVRSSLTLTASISVVKGRLIIAVSLYKVSLVLVSSGVGITDVSSLVPHCGNLLGEIFLPLLNGPLALGFPLPALLGTSLVNVFVYFIEGALVLCV